MTKRFFDCYEDGPANGERASATDKCQNFILDWRTVENESVLSVYLYVGTRNAESGFENVYRHVPNARPEKFTKAGLREVRSRPIEE